MRITNNPSLTPFKPISGCWFPTYSVLPTSLSADMVHYVSICAGLSKRRSSSLFLAGPKPSAEKHGFIWNLWRDRKAGGRCYHGCMWIHDRTTGNIGPASLSIKVIEKEPIYILNFIFAFRRKARKRSIFFLFFLLFLG